MRDSSSSSFIKDAFSTLAAIVIGIATLSVIYSIWKAINMLGSDLILVFWIIIGLTLGMIPLGVLLLIVYLAYQINLKFQVRNTTYTPPPQTQPQIYIVPQQMPYFQQPQPPALSQTQPGNRDFEVIGDT
jgi:hypothetical protein